MNTAKRAALAGLALCSLLASLGTSIANVGLPVFAKTFHATPGQVQWIILAYLLSGTALVVGAGRLGDLLGRRRSLLAGIVLYTSASLACALAPGLGWLIAARALQGAGAALMMALTLALAAEQAAERGGSVMGMLGATSAAGTALGPTLGGALLAWSGWPALFYAGAAGGVAALALAARFLPADTERDRLSWSGLDAGGTLLLAATLTLYALAMSSGAVHGGTLLLLAAACAVLFAVAESAARAPLIRLEMLADAGLGRALAMNVLVATVIMATLVIGPFYLGTVLGAGPLRTGLAMSAGPLVAALGGVPAGCISDQIGAPRAIRAGLVLMAGGCASMALAVPSLGLAGYVAVLALITAGYALFQAANNAAVMKGVAPARRGLVSGLLNLARNLGLISGASLMGSVYAFGGLRLAFGVATALIVAALALTLANRSAWRSLLAK